MAYENAPQVDGSDLLKVLDVIGKEAYINILNANNAVMALWGAAASHAELRVETVEPILRAELDKDIASAQVAEFTRVLGAAMCASLERSVQACIENSEDAKLHLKLAISAVHEETRKRYPGRWFPFVG